MQLCSVSIDMDEVGCYAALHGLPSLAECHAIYDRALPRILDFAARLPLSLTLFVIARDLERDQNVAALQHVVSRGHEIGNHSLDHLYDLTRRSRSEQLRQLVEANDRIESLLGVRPRGFRAPGYTMSDQLMAALQEAGLGYDSSVFPCPPYYTAKAATLLGMKLRRRQSKSVLDTPRVLRAPTIPYRSGIPYWKPGGGMLELPIQVVGPLRLPFIGTSLTLLGPRAARLFTKALLGTEFVNLELHGIDFLDARDVPKSLLAVQPDLHVPLARKLTTLTTVLQTLRTHGYRFVRLDEAARTIAASLS